MPVDFDHQFLAVRRVRRRLDLSMPARNSATVSTRHLQVPSRSKVQHFRFDVEEGHQP
jgi:hypothetical protein